MSLEHWAERYGVSREAVAALAAMLTGGQQFTDDGDALEGSVQQRVRLEAASRGMHLFRNNVGVLTDVETGRPVRFGLANDSKKLNAVLKSGDLIGWRKHTVVADDVGKTIAQFASVECKREGWNYTGHNERERAQMAWLTLVASVGGYAKFATGPGSL